MARSKKLLTASPTTDRPAVQTMSRRNALLGTVAGVAGVASAMPLAAPALAQSDPPIRWRMVTSWPKNLPGPGVTAERLATRIEASTGGRLSITVHAANEIVPALEVFDAVQGGVAHMAHTASFFWQGKARAAAFFTAIPFGLTAPEHAAWILHGGGQALWDKVYAPFGIKPFMAGNTGMQMGGWFKREITSLADLQGLKMRMPGLGGAVLSKLGAEPVTLPPSAIFQALDTGLVDAAEFLGPWSDLAQGFFRAAPFYYAPGFHEPNGTGECIISAEAWAGLPADLQAAVEQACATENAFALAEADWMNGAALAALTDQHDVQLRRYPEDVLAAARDAAVVVLDELSAEDAVFGEVLDSYRTAQKRLADWARVGTLPFLEARAS
jgi:TRAP-type mannitol/chloroaromatic compound transport system substrate-binding protein